MRADLSYDGTAFSGWARQPGRRTVQALVEDGLAVVLRAPVRTTVAGRTDAGVHATGQVIHFDLPAATWEAERALLLRRLAGVLPTDVRVRSLRAAPREFDARFGALARTYAYRVGDDQWGVPPLRRYDTVAWPARLAVDQLQEASDPLVGMHDFVAFCRRRDGATTIRSLECFEWSRDDEGILTAVLRADAFCHSMVRSLVGAALAVGTGRQAMTWPASLLDTTVRSDAVTVAPARGLTLVRVDYPSDDQLAARTTVTRAVRGDVTGRSVR